MNIIKLAGVRDLPRAKKAAASRMDTILLTQAGVKAWKNPPFQRPLRVNDKVRVVAEDLKHNDGVIPGILTLGELGRETYLIDGQHRREAFLLSGLTEGIADVRIVTFEDMAEMGEEFVRLNSSIVKMRPDDVLRGLEESLAPLAEVRRRCPFVGYDQIRRGTASPMLSMSAALRAWFGSAVEIPKSATESAAHLARALTDDEALRLTQYLNIVHSAWGSDPEYWRLWSGLNLTVCAWMWRRTVLAQHSPKSVRLTAMEFGKCAASLSAHGGYLSWLHGRQLTDRDRSPCYARVKAIFAARIKDDKGAIVSFPAPAWSSSHQRGVR